ALGMLVAVVVTMADRAILSYTAILAGLVVGSAIGVFLARTVEMTAMPQMVALLNGFGGGASALVALVEVYAAADDTQTLVTIAVSILIGVITLTGSLVAFAKLQGIVSGSPITYPGQRIGDSVIALATVFGACAIVASGGSAGWAWATTAVAGVLGVVRVLPIGGADMPVVISFLNSASGLAASAAGFVIRSNALIISGALVGAA